MTIEQLKKNINKGYPVLIMLQAWVITLNYTPVAKQIAETVTGLLQLDMVKIISTSKIGFWISWGYFRMRDLDSRWHDYEYLSEKDSKARNRYHSDHYGIAITVKRQGSKKVQAEEIP